MTPPARDERRWIICDCCGQTWSLPSSLAMEHHGSCRPEDWRVVMPVAAHNVEMATVAVELGKDIIRAEAALAAARQVDRKTVVKMIWDALESTDDWGSINDVQDLADALLAALTPEPEEKRCARDSDWCDGVICRDRGVDCPNAEPGEKR